MEKASPPPQQLAYPSTTVLSLSTTLSFVIPSEAEGSAVPRTPNKFLVLWVLGLASSPREEPWNYKNLCLGWSGTADPSAPPDFPIESCGFGQLRVVLFTENHMRGRG
jgi:hypothetical protein